jgi:DNA-binding transcriptional ArsR family regulator
MDFLSTQYEQAALIFRGLSHPIRIRIVEILKRESLRTVEIAESIGYEPPVITKQLLYLRQSGIVVRTRKGMNYYYCLSKPVFGDVMKCLHNCLNK